MGFVDPVRATTKCQIYLDSNTLHEATQCKITHVNSLINTSTCIIPHFLGKAVINLQAIMFCITLLQRIKEMANDEYRSSRNIAISLFKLFKNAVEWGRGDNLKEFISAGVNAYALGCTDEGLRKELNDMREYGVEIEAMQSYGGTTSLKSKIILEEVDECILWLSIIFITILCTPQPTIVRWSSTPPVSDDVTAQWKGFCAGIANAYFVRGMAWYVAFGIFHFLF
ncbi:hypothetical protein ACB092_01G409100 [Castanea dentata]